MQIKTEDKIVQAVLRKMDDRSIIGQKKYGQTMQNEIETSALFDHISFDQ